MLHPLSAEGNPPSSPTALSGFPERHGSGGHCAKQTQDSTITAPGRLSPSLPTRPHTSPETFTLSRFHTLFQTPDKHLCSALGRPPQHSHYRPLSLCAETIPRWINYPNMRQLELWSLSFLFSPRNVNTPPPSPFPGCDVTREPHIHRRCEPQICDVIHAA